MLGAQMPRPAARRRLPGERRCRGSADAGAQMPRMPRMASRGCRDAADASGCRGCVRMPRMPRERRCRGSQMPRPAAACSPPRPLEMARNGSKLTLEMTRNGLLFFFCVHFERSLTFISLPPPSAHPAFPLPARAPSMTAEPSYPTLRPAAVCRGPLHSPSKLTLEINARN